jgi:hypothetical protein
MRVLKLVHIEDQPLPSTGIAWALPKMALVAVAVVVAVTMDITVVVDGTVVVPDMDGVTLGRLNLPRPS